VESADKAILVSLDPPQAEETEWALAELRELADSAGVTVVGEFHQRRSRPDPAYLIGHGKAEELYEEVQALGATVVIFGEDLNPTQQRNVENTVLVRVIDRTQLILDIFAQRAHTKEGKLQVELAQLAYLLPKLTGRGVEMTRLGGGVGTRGPGETKLEVDRRRIRTRITDLEEDLEEVVKRRGVQKQARSKLPFPSAALVGYTSAGKSTLLNTLSGSDVLVDRRLFATLDPTTRRVVLPDGWAVLMSDTVGFIRNLPHHLVAAFKATLEEVVDADFLIHVVDSSHPKMLKQMEAVQEVLRELGAEDKPIVTVFNKSDLSPDQYELRRLVTEVPNSAYMSAMNREGIGHLMDRIIATIKSLLIRVTLEIPYERSDLVSVCYESGRVISADYQNDKIIVLADVARDVAARLENYRRDI
jgi:GTPase